MSGARRLTLYEPFRSIFYAPQFVALYGGHFAGEGLDVQVETAGRGVTTTGALIDGHAEIALGGIMRSLDVADRGGPSLPHFAAVNQRNGFFLLSREPRPGFAWADVVGKTIVSFAEAPTPWQCMLTVLRKHGVDPATVRIERTLPLPEAVAPAFPDIDQATRLRAVRRYLGQDTWARDPILERPGYEYLQQILLDGGFITRRHRYDDLIDTAIARDVVGDAARRS